MKLSDFTLETHNTSRPGETPKYEEWQTGSHNNRWAIGTLGMDGKRYQIKVHEAAPTWNFVDQKIRDKKAELRACNPSDDVNKERLQNDIDSLVRSRAKLNQRDKDSDNYLESKKRLINVINGIGSSQLVCPVEFWAEPLENKGGGTFVVEAVPWVDSKIGFDGDKPTDFRRDLTLDQQYDVIASLCEQLDNLHNKGVLHSDLKIGNTIVSKDDEGLKCTIIDFDSSILLQDLYDSKYNMAVWNLIIGGTFFSPELHPLFEITSDNTDPDAFDEFDMHSITTKSDIFSLGITIYEYFFGPADGANVMPFIGPDGSALDDAEYYYLAVEQDYKPNLPDTVDELLCAAINWMVAKDPNDRPTAKQLAKVFRSRDITLIPTKYTRNPLWEEHQGKYKLNLPEGTVIEKALQPRYRLRIKGTSVTRSVDELVKKGYLVPIDVDGKEIIEEKKEDLSNKAWETDGGMELPPCVSRAAVAGRYILYANGISRGVSFSQIKQDGYICTEAEKATPWPCDKGLKYLGSRPIYRDMDPGKGAGFYTAGTGISRVRYTTKSLIECGLASTGVSFSLCRDDAEIYTPAFDKVPNNVKSITRSAVVNHQYRIEYTDGTLKKVMISDMERLGYVTKK